MRPCRVPRLLPQSGQAAPQGPGHKGRSPSPHAGRVPGHVSGHLPTVGSRHLLAHRLKQHFLLPSHWSSLEHSLLSTQGPGVCRACTWGQRPAFGTGTREREPALHGPVAVLGPPSPHPRGPGASYMGGVYGAVGRSLREGCGGRAQGRPVKNCPLRPRAGVLPMKGTMQDRPQGLRAQHLVPWGQFWSVTQACTQDSSEEEELSSGHTAACPAHRRQVGRGAAAPASPRAPRGQGGQGQEAPRVQFPAPRHPIWEGESIWQRRARADECESAARIRELGLGHRRGGQAPHAQLAAGHLSSWDRGVGPHRMGVSGSGRGFCRH